MVNILSEISEVITNYQSGAYLSQEKLLEAQRTLSSNVYHLTLEYLKYKKMFNSLVYTRGQENGKKESIASAEARAQFQYPEVYECKKILEACKGVSIAMNYELQLMSKD